MSLLDSSFGSRSLSPTALVYPLNHYTFGVKDPKPEKDASVAARLARMERIYNEEGMRRSGMIRLSW